MSFKVFRLKSGLVSPAIVSMLVLAGPRLATCADPPHADALIFEKHVEPIFRQHCVECHGAEKQENGLDLRSPASMLVGGESGVAIVLNKPGESLLYQVMESGDMPPSKKSRVSDAELAIVRTWIENGALSESNQTATTWADRLAAAKSHWAFVPPKRTPVPGELALKPSQPALAPDADSVRSALVCWFDAASLGLEDGSPVSDWPDRGPRHYTAAATRRTTPTGTGLPPGFVVESLLNGRPAVRFNESSGLGVPVDGPFDIVGDAGFTIIVVMQLNRQSGNYPFDHIVGFGEPAPSGNPGRPLAAVLELDRTPTGNGQVSVAGGFGNNALFGTGSFQQFYSRPILLSVTKTPGPMACTTKISINGRPLGGETAGAVGGSDESPDIKTRPDFCLFLGRAFDGLGGFSGDVGDVLIYNRPLGDVERAGVEASLIAKYDLREPIGKTTDWKYSDGGGPRSDLELSGNPIDAFIAAKHSEHQLVAAPQADKRTLVRRAYFDLLGLPPTPEQVDQFVNDSSADAFSRLVDELLASPHYGERWGRHWLDVARYADSGGYETDIYYRNAWRYRDYVIKSFNDDKPYDRFVQEQIAGDELWPENLALSGSANISDEQRRNLEARIGTGLYALGPQVHESNLDARKALNERLTDWVDTTGAAFLGMTIGCARCHDHKFDPISQRDYYGLQAIFASSKETEQPLFTPMEIADFKQFYPRLVAVDEARKAYRLFEQSLQGRAPTEEESTRRRQLLEAIGTAVLNVPENASAPGSRFDGLMEVPVASVLGAESPAFVPTIHRLSRGELDRPKEVIEPALPEFLSQSDVEIPSSLKSYGARTRLAQWLTRADHPLTSRVMVNRIWQWHFGRGLVSTASDFGKMGAAPSHPELLDWLATEFVAVGWSVKKMHRLIMNSRTYQMASGFAAAGNVDVDPHNQFLWRMNRRRLEGEAIWDATHSVAGTLNPTVGGRPVVPPVSTDEISPLRDTWHWTVSADPSDHHRRAVYILQRRNYRFPTLDLFDAPGNSSSCPVRDVSTVALQALWGLNNGMVLEQAEQYAKRVRELAGEDAAAQVRTAWRLALGRAPSSEEAVRASQMVAEVLASQTAGSEPVSQNQAALQRLCLMIFNLNEFLFID